MAYAEHYVTNGAQASDVNGGGPNLDTDDAAPWNAADCTSNVDGTTITDNEANGWTLCSVGDSLCFDIAGAKDHARVTNKVGDVLTVSPAVTASQANKEVNVGGAWADFTAAIGFLEGMKAAFADGTPPKLNVKGDHTITDNVLLTTGWTKALPLIIQGYGATAGDQPATKPVITYAGANDMVDWATFDNTAWADLHFLKTGNNAAHVFDCSSEIGLIVRCTLEATVGTGHVLRYLGLGGAIIDSHVLNSGTAAGLLTISMQGSAVNVIFQGGNVYTVSGPLIRCQFKAAYVSEWRPLYGAMIAGGTMTDIPAAHHAIDVDVAGTFPAIVLNTIIQDVPNGKYALHADVANYGAVFADCNCFHNPLGGDIDTTTFQNHVGGANDVYDDPDLDVNGIPKIGSPALGAGKPTFIDIGARQRKDVRGVFSGRLLRG